MSATPTSSRQNQAGFTLVELLVSILLMGLVLGGLGAGLSTIAKGWDRHSAHLANQDMLVRAQSQLLSDIAGLQRISWPTEQAARGSESRTADADADPAPRFIFAGEASRLRFVVIEPPRPVRPGPYMLTYTAAEDGRLVRSRARFHPDFRDLDTPVFKDAVDLIAGPYRFTFSYGRRLSAEDGGSEAWRWSPSWPPTDALPALIKLEVRDLRTGALLLAPIVARPRIDAEQACAAKRKASAGCTVALNARGDDTSSRDDKETGDAARPSTR